MAVAVAHVGRSVTACAGRGATASWCRKLLWRLPVLFTLVCLGSECSSPKPFEFPATAGLADVQKMT